MADTAACSSAASKFKSVRTRTKTRTRRNKELITEELKKFLPLRCVKLKQVTQLATLNYLAERSLKKHHVRAVVK